ncbi:pilus assembly protein PilM [Patescibacteria group bacterium]|nr:pilus assembly protein PilM [Patescibacteria group bacterium]MBU1921594.1 pilus assembly protein PilM [Patescibacteria group bacterium]
MPFFKKPIKKSYLGVDFGASGIKIAELMNEKGRARLLTYGYSDRPFDSMSTNIIDTAKDTADLIRKICAKANTSSIKAVAGLPVASVFSSIVTVQAKNKNELQAAIHAKAKKLIPLPIEEMIIDSKVLDKIPEKGEFPKDLRNVRVLLTGAPKNIVKKYIEIFKLAGLELLSLETEAFALIRSLVGKDPSPIMIIDFGSMRTNLSVIEKGTPFLNRSINMGGHTLTKTISQSLGVSLKQAEQMKRDISALTRLAPGGSLPKLLDNLLQPIVNEIKYSLNMYAGQKESEGTTVEKIILTGGSSLLPNFSDYFTKLLNINTYLGDPWARVIYPLELKPVLQEMGPRFSVAIGLAMRDIG